MIIQASLIGSLLFYIGFIFLKQYVARIAMMCAMLTDNSKWEQFIVVEGHGLIQERNINTDEFVEFEVSGDHIEAVYMIPGWTHNIINLSKTDNLVTVMTCNEIFNKEHPDTFFEIVK